MGLIHERQLETAYVWSDIPVACDGQHLAMPLSKTVVAIWGLDALHDTQPVELVGHHREITALCLGHGVSPKLLCSASDDYIIVWNIHQAWQNFKQGETIRGCIVGTSLGPPQSMAFSPDDTLLAVAVQNNVLILSAMKEDLRATLEGHTSMVTCVEFCPHYSATVVSASDDRTFKVWNVEDLSLVYQSSIVSASPFIVMTMNPNKEQVAIGTTDGQLRVYDLSDGNGFRCLHHVDVAKVIDKLEREKEDAEMKDKKTGPVTVSSRPSWQREVTPTDGDTGEDCGTERGCSILALCYTRQGALPPITAEAPALVQRENTAVRDVLTSSCTLVVATSVGLLQLNAFTLDVCAFISLSDPIQTRNYVEAESISLPPVGSAHLAVANRQQVWCILGSLFQNRLDVLRWKLSDISKPSSTAEVLGEENLPENVAEVLQLSPGTAGSWAKQISVLSSEPLEENSILRAELIPKKKEEVKKSTKGKLASSASKKGLQAVKDQPLTFKPKVKSSGYSTAPRRGMFQPDMKMTKRKSPPQSPSQSLIHRLSERAYPVDSPPPSRFVSSQAVAERPTAINCLAFSGGGQSLACGLGNNAVQEFRLPLTGKGTAYTGHNAPVHSVHYSHTDHRFVSSAEDRSARMWVKGQAEPILVIDRVDNNFTADSSATKPSNKQNSTFPKDVRFAQFYYVDKFILLASGNYFYLYKYHLDTTKDEIKRYLSKSRYKLVKSFPLDQAQSITRLSAVNSFHSYVTMAAGSDRSLCVYDMNAGKVSRVMTNVHTKPCHVISLNEGSAAVSHAASVYDLFATAAMMDCIKLWDIRTDRCVRRYEGHQNRSYPCGLSLSPCCRFLATGAEDKSAYIYDLRSGTYLHKLTGHTDVVSDVAFHPLKPQLLTACLDGRVRLFTDKG